MTWNPLSRVWVRYSHPSVFMYIYVYSDGKDKNHTLFFSKRWLSSSIETRRHDWYKTRRGRDKEAPRPLTFATKCRGHGFGLEMRDCMSARAMGCVWERVLFFFVGGEGGRCCLCIVLSYGVTWLERVVWLTLLPGSLLFRSAQRFVSCVWAGSWITKMK